MADRSVHPNMLRQVSDESEALSAYVWRDGPDARIFVGDYATDGLVIPAGLMAPLGEALIELAPMFMPYVEFEFVGDLGRHKIQVAGFRRPGHIRKIKVQCITCKETLLDATNPSLELAIAAVENHG